MMEMVDVMRDEGMMEIVDAIRDEGIVWRQLMS